MHVKIQKLDVLKLSYTHHLAGCKLHGRRDLYKEWPAPLRDTWISISAFAVVISALRKVSFRIATVWFLLTVSNNSTLTLLRRPVWVDAICVVWL